MIKRRWILLVVAAVLSLASIAHAEPLPVRVLWDGQELMGEAQPIIVDGRTFIPFEWLGDYFGADLTCYRYSYCVVTQGDSEMTIQVQSGHIFWNSRLLDQRAVTLSHGEEERLYVPLRLIVEGLGGEVTWDGEERTVRISGHLRWPPPLERLMVERVYEATERICQFMLVRCDYYLPNMFVWDD